MKIAKEFDWEMGHRLPFHKGKCKNLHGHSYKMVAEVEGDLDENGMVLDYYDLKKVIAPLVEKLDHAFLAYEGDKELVEVLTKLGSKFVEVNFHSTAENICNYFLSAIKQTGMPSNIKKVKIRVSETHDSYAENEITFF